MPSRFLEPPITPEEKAAADRVLRADRDLRFDEDLAFEIRAAVAAETARCGVELEAAQVALDGARATVAALEDEIGPLRVKAHLHDTLYPRSGAEERKRAADIAGDEAACW